MGEAGVGCEMSFAEWTSHGQMRQTTFLGVRPDKSPKESGSGVTDLHVLSRGLSFARSTLKRAPGRGYNSEL